MFEKTVKDFLTNQEFFFRGLEEIENIEKNIGCVDGKIIGTGRADYTQGSTIYDLHVGEKTFALIDIPGIEGDESLYEEGIKQSLEKAHAIFYVNGSGKKIEKATLDKIKKYMRDGTSVYALFNVHCKAKKERIEGIDTTYSEELENAYSQQQEIILQTETELMSFLEENYRGSNALNGLLSFCSLAIDETGNTTIVDEKDKNLRNDQLKYLKEYANDTRKMLAESKIGIIKDIISEKIDSFESEIYDENIKKLRNRIAEMIKEIEKLQSGEKVRIKEFCELYDDYKSNCYDAKKNYIEAIRNVSHSAASDAFLTFQEELFKKIENDKGKTDAKEIQEIFENKKDAIIADIQKKVNEKFEAAQVEYQEAFEEAQTRLIKDFEREQTKFEVSLSSNKILLDDKFGDALKYSFKDFKKHLGTTGGLILSGAEVGSLIAPGIGTAVGAVIGGVLGILSSIWNFFVSEKPKINKAKEKLRQTIRDQIYDVSDMLKKEIDKLGYESIINENYNQICEEAEKQKESLRRIDNLLMQILKDLRINYRKIA